MANKLETLFEGLEPREKIIVAITGFFVIWGLWDSLFYQPLQEKRNTLQQTEAQLTPQISNLQLRFRELEQHPVNDPNQSNQTKLSELKVIVLRRQEQMLMGYKRFVPPKQMAKALADMFNQHAKIHLIKLDILPVTTLLTSKQLKPIYKHGLAITITGGYLETLHYLQSLETLPWHFNWDSIDYQVKEHPVAETTLRVYTLSFEQEWLGV